MTKPTQPPITNELMYEVLKAIRADVTDLKRDAKDTKAQLHGLRAQMNALQSQMQDDMLRLERNMAAFQDRLERIETSYPRQKNRCQIHRAKDADADDERQHAADLSQRQLR